VVTACTRSGEPGAVDRTEGSAAATTGATAETTIDIAADDSLPAGTGAPEPIPPPPVDLDADAFGLGVASGDPDASSVVLWTRLVGQLPETVPVVWELSLDPLFAKLAATELTTANASTGHSLHALPTGLEPATNYFYRFLAGSLVSTVGTTRTLPAPEDNRVLVLAVSSCQAAEDGAYAAHADIAAAKLDLVVWLGDYIYGGAATLEEFRAAYANYRRNPLLQASHAAHPWVLIADDHEVLNDYDASVDPTVRAAAYRAWWENQPTRLPQPGTGEPFTFYRNVDLGGMGRLILTDSRQYADGVSLFGADQTAFLEDAFRHNKRWTVLASSVLASGLTAAGEMTLGYTLDGYPTEREVLAGWLGQAPSPLILSGDLHMGMMLDFSADPANREAAVVATELMAPAISSAFPADLAPFAPFLPLLNPHLRHIDVANGWLKLTLEATGATAEFRTVVDIANPASSLESIQFMIEAP